MSHLSFGSRFYFETTPMKIDILLGIDNSNRDGQENESVGTFGIAFSY